MKLSEIKIYRMIHIENLSHVLQYGITHKNSRNANPNFVPIGDQSLIDTRSSKAVYVNNGDFRNLDVPEIILGDFIPFYFGVRMPMLYVIKVGGNFVKEATLPEEIIYLVCSIKNVIDSNIVYYFTDGHGTDNFTTFYDKSRVADLPTLVDWDAVKASYWGGFENLNLKRKKQAEFLVNEDIPPDYLFGFGCYNEKAKQRLIAEGVQEGKIKVIPNAYF